MWSSLISVVYVYRFISRFLRFGISFFVGMNLINLLSFFATLTNLMLHLYSINSCRNVFPILFTNLLSGVLAARITQ
jgi:hypothetical protein